MSINQLRDLTPANAVLVANELTGSSKDNWLKAVLEKQIELSTSESLLSYGLHISQLYLQ